MFWGTSLKHCSHRQKLPTENCCGAALFNTFVELVVYSVISCILGLWLIATSVPKVGAVSVYSPLLMNLLLLKVCIPVGPETMLP